MSYSGDLRTDFGGDEQVFRANVKALREIQSRTGKGPEALLNSLQNSTWGPDDIIAIHRVTLEEGGMEPLAAKSLVERYIIERPKWLDEHKPRAFQILYAGLQGMPDDEPKKTDKAGSDTPVPDKWRFANIYSTGAQIGMTPTEVGQCSMWEFMTAVDGYIKAQGGGNEDEAMPDDEHEAMVAAFKAREGLG